MTPIAPSYDPQGQTPRPYVRFDRRSVEVREGGQPVFVDRDWVTLMAPGSRDTVEMLVEDWLQKLEDHARANRVPMAWPQEYRGAYETWTKTQDQPTSGTSLKNWAAISPAQRENCLRANLHTVEDLAGANSEALQRIGMGSVGLKQMAEAWIKDQKGSGKLAADLQALSIRLAELEAANETLRTDNAALAAKVTATAKA
jgi:hypothetical protein